MKNKGLIDISKNKVDVLRDRSFGKRKRLTLSPDHNLKGLNSSKTSIYDKVRRKVDNIVKAERTNQLFVKSPEKHRSSKVFEKKRIPLIEQPYKEEESRELIVTKDSIPQIDSKPESLKEIFISRVTIKPITFNKPFLVHSDINNNITGDSSFKIDIQEMKDQLLSEPNENKHHLSTVEDSSSGVKRRIDFDSQTIVPFNHQIQSTYSSLYKSKSKIGSDIGDTNLLISQKKKSKKRNIASYSIINQQNSRRSSIKTVSEPSQFLTDELNSLKEEKLRTKNEMKFLSMNTERLKNEIVELNEELNIIRFERDNAITNYNKAARNIQGLNKEVDNLQNRIQKSSSRFGQLIDYLYRLNDPKHIEVLETIIGADEKHALDDLQTRVSETTKRLTDIIDLVYLSKDEELIDKLNAIIKKKHDH